MLCEAAVSMTSPPSAAIFFGLEIRTGPYATVISSYAHMLAIDLACMGCYTLTPAREYLRGRRLRPSRSHQLSSVILTQLSLGSGRWGPS